MSWYYDKSKHNCFPRRRIIRRIPMFPIIIKESGTLKLDKQVWEKFPPGMPYKVLLWQEEGEDGRCRLIFRFEDLVLLNEKELYNSTVTKRHTLRIPKKVLPLFLGKCIYRVGPSTIFLEHPRYLRYLEQSKTK